MDEINQADIQFRKAGKTDVLPLATLSAETFHAAYHLQNTTEDMELYIQEHFLPKHISDELNSESITIFIALHNEKMIGYVKLDLVNSSYMQEGKGCEISRYYVTKEFQQLKVGSKLMNISENFAFEHHCNYLWLGVWQKNEQAIAIYKHRGFEIAGTTTFILGEDVQYDFVMIKNIKNEDQYNNSYLK